MSLSEKKICAFAPATVANVGPGYDCFGFAFGAIGDVVQVSRKSKPGVELTVLGGFNQLPTNPSQNCASRVAQVMLASANVDFGVKMTLIKNLPLNSGLGSSGSSSAAAAVAINKLLNNPYSERELVNFAVEGEMVACGTKHYDNVAPSIMGGFVLIRPSITGPEFIRVRCPKDWYVSVIHPKVAVPTKLARDVVPKTVEISEMVNNTANAATMIVALLNDDIKLFGRAIMEENIVTPARSALIPHYTAVHVSAYGAGAVGASISGSGPSIFAISDSYKTAMKVIRAMNQALVTTFGIGADVYVSRFGALGAKLVGH